MLVRLPLGIVQAKLSINTSFILISLPINTFATNLFTALLFGMSGPASANDDNGLAARRIAQGQGQLQLTRVLASCACIAFVLNLA